MTVADCQDNDLGKTDTQLLQVWQAMKLSGWNTTIPMRLATCLARLAQICGQSHRSGLGDRVLDTEVYLSSFVDSDLVPDQGQLKVLLGLIRDCRSAITVTQRDESTGSKTTGSNTSDPVADRTNQCVFFLKSDESKYISLTTALHTHRFVVRSFVKLADFLHALDTEKPSVLILQMQFLDALDRIDQRLYRNAEDQCEHTPIVILSSNNSPEERLKAMGSGVDALISEPFSVTEVLAQIDGLLTDDQVQPFRVMIIDDDRQQAMICAAVLRRKGMHTQIYTGGREALRELTAFGPDLILVDLHMPKMDGLQFTARVREKQDFFTIPIIFLSGDEDLQTRFDALSLGGNDFLLKPIRPNHLIAAVWSRLKFSRKLRHYLGHPVDKDEETGLFRFSRLLELGEELFETGASQRRAFMFQIGFINAEELEENFGATEVLELQQHLAAFIVSQFRKTDVIASQRYFLFSALIEGVSEQQATELATRMLGRVEGRLLRLDRFTFSTSLCIGICKLVDAVGDINHAIRLAAKACRQAANDGGNKWVITQREGAQNESNAGRLMHLIGADEVSAFDSILFQPLARLHGKTTDQYRIGLWVNSTENGNSCLEELEMASLEHTTRASLDLWLLAHGLKQAQQGRSDGVDVHVRIALGLGTLNDDMFVDFVEAALGAAKISPPQLTVVLSRKLAMGVIDNLVEIVNSVRNLGVKVGLEGVIGDKSELEFIERFPIASVELASNKQLTKLDKEGNARSIDTVVKALHELGVEVLAPDADDPELLAAHWKWGVDYAYGDVIQAPMEIANYKFE